jgi:RNA polymerase sigma factor (sigma-70 family)
MIARLARLAGPPEPDARLLERFARQRDEAAFRTLVDRHAGLVLGVCRRALGPTPDAEDAFQATFLVLARSADRVRRPEALGCWLYGVARRVANKVRARRRRRPPRPEPRPEPPADAAAAWRELQLILDEELARLPARYREPVVLCGLQDLTQEEAAARIGCPVGTVKSRLTRGRELLRTRLLRRGITPAVAGTALLLAADRGPAAVPIPLAESTMSLTFHPAPATAAAKLADAVLRSAVRAKLAAVGLITMVILAGVAWAVGPGRGPTRPAPPVVASAPAETPKVAVDAVGDPLPAGETARLGTTRFRHMHTVRSVAFTTNGQAVITRSWDDTSRVWSLPAGKELRRVTFPFLENGKADPNGVKWNVIAPDGVTGLSYTTDGHLRFTDLTTGRVRKDVATPEFAAPAAFVRGAFRADGKVVAALAKGTVNLWDIAAGKVVISFPVPFAEGDLVLSPDGKTLTIVYRQPKTATDAEPGAVSLWDVAAGKELRRLSGHGDSIYQAAFSPDGKRLVTGGGIQDKTVRIWDVDAGTELVRIPGPGGWVRPVDFSPDGKTVAAGGQDGIIRLYDAATGKERRRLVIPGQDDVYGPWVMSVAFAPDGKTLVSCGTEKAVRVWDLATGKETAGVTGHQDEVTGVVVTPDGKTAISSGKDSALIVWDLATGRERARWAGHHDGINALALSPDGNTLVSAGKQVFVWDVATGKRLHELIGHTKAVGAVALAADGVTVATAGNTEHAVRLWDAATGRPDRTIDVRGGRNPGSGSIPLTFADGGRLLVTGSGNRGAEAIVVWDVATGTELRRIPGAAEHLAASPDGRVIAVVGWTDEVRLIDPRTGAELLKIKATAGPVAFSPDGNTLAVGGGDGTARLFEAATGFERARFAGHHSGRRGRSTFAAGVAALAFTRDGRSLVTGGGDTTLLTWSLLPPEPANASLERRAKWWDDLAGDPAVADRAMREMLAAPDAAVAELKSHLHPTAAPDAARVADLVRRLDSDRFAAREQAAADLARLGDPAVPLLKPARDRATTEEVRTRLDAILARLQNPTSPDRLRLRRAIEVLERTRTPKARELLKALAGGGDGAAPTDAARAALGRLNP